MKRYIRPEIKPMEVAADDVIRTSGLVEADNSDDFVWDIWSIESL